MDELFKILPGVVAPTTTASRGARQSGVAPSANFAEVLARQSQIPVVRFSRHAQERMASRGISLSPEELTRLNRAVSNVEAKGGRDSLVFLDGKALVVSVKNQTVVTVVAQEALKENVFTNIDSAIIA